MRAGLKQEKSSDIGESQVQPPKIRLREKTDNSHKRPKATLLKRPTGGNDNVAKPRLLRANPETAVLADGRKSEADKAVNPLSLRLVSDIWKIFLTRAVSKLRTKHLLDCLCSDMTMPWATYNSDGGKIKARQISNLLKAFKIQSDDIRFDTKIFKGYQKKKFVKATLLRIMAQHQSKGNNTAKQP